MSGLVTVDNWDISQCVLYQTDFSVCCHPTLGAISSLRSQGEYSGQGLVVSSLTGFRGFDVDKKCRFGRDLISIYTTIFI